MMDAAVSCAASCESILASLRVIYVMYQSAHWTSRGESFYGDHLLHQRAYEAIAEEVDSIAERALGLGASDGILDPSRQLMMMVRASRVLMTSGSPLQVLLAAERAFLKQLDDVLGAENAQGMLSGGLEDLLQGIASTHETHVYLLTRRIGECVVHACVHEASSRKKKRKKKRTFWYAGHISSGPGGEGSSTGGCE